MVMDYRTFQAPMRGLLEAVRTFKEILWNTFLLWWHILPVSKMPMGLNISPSVWQSYINTILDCLQSRKYCEAIMDDLLLTSSKGSHIA